MGQTLKETLQVVKQNDYVLPGDYNLKEITLDMIRYIGDSDPDLRDELIYRTFYYWIVDKKYYESEDLREMMNIAIDENHLTFKLGAKDDDSVLTRSFSVLLIALLIYRQEIDGFFSEEEFKQVKEKLYYYYRNEKDYRGYIPELGWAHSVAHGADALDQIIVYKADHDDLVTILNLIKEKTVIDSYVYRNEEDERMVTAISGAIKTGLLSESEIKEWIKDFVNHLPKDYPIRHNSVTNIKALLRSLYFRLLDHNKYESIRNEIVATLSKIK